MVLILSNTVAAEGAPEDAPLKDGADPYRFEMYFDGDARRAYADTAAELLDALIPGYTGLDEQARLTARLHLAVRAQTTVQADINYQFGLTGTAMGQATPQEYAVLQASRATAPHVATWDSVVPLVLVDSFYAPATDVPRPVSGLADVAEPDNLFWLSPGEEYEFLASLHRIGLIGLHEHQEYAA